jgi:hypothetical protein
MERTAIVTRPDGTVIWKETDRTMSIEYRRTLTGEKVTITGFASMKQVREEVRLMER